MDTKGSRLLGSSALVISLAVLASVVAAQQRKHREPAAMDAQAEQELAGIDAQWARTEEQRRTLFAKARGPRPASEFPSEAFKRAFDGKGKVPGVLLWFPDRVILVTSPIERASGDFTLGPDSTVTAYWGHPISEPRVTVGWQVSKDGTTWTTL